MTTTPQSERDAERERNRAAFPELASIMDDMRRVFGPGVRLRDGSEGGRSIGRTASGANKNPAEAGP